jgi:2-polyprenyl-6-methoxyphenol hydroxylase-like FAD-dependent oxidoreductase
MNVNSPTTSRSSPARVVIVGGGFGGLRAAHALRRTGVQITLVDRTKSPPVLVGFRNRVSVLLEWAYAYFTYQRGMRLITGVDVEATRAGTRHASRQGEANAI